MSWQDANDPDKKNIRNEKEQNANNSDKNNTRNDEGKLTYDFDLTSPYLRNLNKKLTFTVAEDQFTTGYEYRCVITDKLGNSVTSDAVRVLKPDPFVVAMQPVHAEVYVGDSTGAYVEVTGGVGPYTYTWYWRDVGKEEWGAFHTGSSYTARANAYNDYELKLEVTDSKGNTETATVLIKIVDRVN